ncbi:restriction endonuclease subunit S [Fibrella aquatilis]|uniref:Restriction endonuclease subunit S n=1 Tax=Fibrella aquatilis TaxID=2817059 RepID=A0A939G8F7_9BACT|nr:restriction endonuclease subunit S [Fibrella aquatilis]MBO0932280.1 restriction endonuclease subunit S [Fibrella aquatilis]
MTFTPYDNYKDSGMDWLGNVPAHWKMNRVKNVGNVNARVGWKALKASEYVDSGYFFLATPNIKGRKIDYDNVNYITHDRFIESPEIILQENDILLAKDGSTLGIVNIVKHMPGPGTVNSSIAVMRFNKTLDNNYIYYQIASEYIQNIIKLKKDGQGVPHLFQRDINNFLLVVPPLAEQAAIANYLDWQTAAIDKKTALLQHKIATYLALRKAVINETVCRGLDKSAPLKDSGIEWIGQIPTHWDVKRIKDVCAINPSTSKVWPTDSSNKVEFLPMTNIDEKFGTIKSYGFEDYNNVNQGYTAFRNGDILFAKITPCMENGNCVIVEGLKNDLGFGSTEFIVFRVLKKYLNTRYLHLFLRNERFLRKAENFMVGTAGQKRISTSFLQVHPVAFPPLEEQIAIATYLDQKTQAIDAAVANLNAQLSTLAELRKTLINEVVTGQIRVAMQGS